MSETRFTWTYGASEGTTIFINDNTLPNPKESGIAAIVCYRIGNKEGEQLAKAFCCSLSMLALLEKALPIIEEEAKRRSYSYSPKQATDPYWTEMRELANEIAQEIDKARGKEVSDG